MTGEKRKPRTEEEKRDKEKEMRKVGKDLYDHLVQLSTYAAVVEMLSHVLKQ